MSSVINIAEQYSRSPAGRLRTDGPFSGERFREEILVPALQASDDWLEVDLRGALGFGSSFLEEAFGGLVRNGLYSAEQLHRRLRIKSDVNLYERRIWAYVRAARPRA